MFVKFYEDQYQKDKMDDGRWKLNDGVHNSMFDHVMMSWVFGIHNSHIKCQLCQNDYSEQWTISAYCPISNNKMQSPK